jgi:tetratricopeptide (TPR) repeat protein
MRTEHFCEVLLVKLRTAVSVILLSVVFIGCAISEPRFEVDLVNSAIPTRKALLRGEIKGALAFYEAEAREADKNAAASWFSQQDWVIATVAYREASSAARQSGELQKAIAYAERSLAAAERSTNPVYEARAISELVKSYSAVRNFESARKLTARGLAIVQKSHNSWWMSTFYSHLGEDFIRRREYGEAVEAFSQSLYLAEASLSVAWRRSSNEVLTERTGVVLKLTGLGNAYRRAGQLDQALEQYERAFRSIRDWKLQYPHEGRLYEAVGELYLRQNKFPEALESFKKALSIAESQQTPLEISSANRNIGDVLWQSGKRDEAITHYQTAIQQIESVRSVLQAEKFRQSYFEGQLHAYVRMVDVLLSAGKPEQAFDYSERSRSRAFLDLLGSKAQLSRVKGGLLEEERTLQERIAAIRARLSGEDIGEADRAGLRKARQKQPTALFSPRLESKTKNKPPL